MVGEIFALLKNSAKQGLAVLSPLDVYIDGANVVQPDVFWIHKDNQRCVHRDGYWHGAPDLVVEALSPATEKRDRGAKFRIYRQSGVREYWIADPRARFIEVFTRQDDQFVQQGLYGEGETFTSPVLDGLTIAVDPLLSVFAENE